MGAFAWQLCCRAHARAYYDHAFMDHHAASVTACRRMRQCGVRAATSRLSAPEAASPLPNPTLPLVHLDWTTIGGL